MDSQEKALQQGTEELKQAEETVETTTQEELKATEETAVENDQAAVEPEQQIRKNYATEDEGNSSGKRHSSKD